MSRHNCDKREARSKTRTEYVIFDKILTFDVDEYEINNPPTINPGA